MKKIPSMAGVLIIVLLLSVKGQAQVEPEIRTVPEWISEKGYWEVVNNIKTPDTFTVYFFNNEGTVVYKEKVEGVKLNIKNRKTLMRLRRVLDQSVVGWENNHLVKDDSTLVAAIFRRNGGGH